MPIFEYSCSKCGEEFEELVFNDSNPVPCPKCGSEETGKLMSCCRHKHGGASSVGQASSTSASSGCAGCSGGNCSTCH